MSTMNSFLGDELAHKVKYLSRALHSANLIISKLEEENRRLKEMLLALELEKDISFSKSDEALFT
jgi:hypothetical protein